MGLAWDESHWTGNWAKIGNALNQFSTASWRQYSGGNSRGPQLTRLLENRECTAQLTELLFFFGAVASVVPPRRWAAAGILVILDYLLGFRSNASQPEPCYRGWTTVQNVSLVDRCLNGELPECCAFS